jgi:hypothetical protein
LKDAGRGAKALGIENVRFRQEDVIGLDPLNVMQCDYVIGHGLYSWVAEDRREAIFAFCEAKLGPTGLVYISYNCQPGWSTRRLVREAIQRSRTVQRAPTEERAGLAIDLAARLLEDFPSRDYAHAVLLAEELERVRNGRPSYVFHEYLAEINEGFWLGDFVESARRHGLEYVADAQFCRWEGHVPAELRSALANRGMDRIEQEETADLLGDRYFRASILCRADAPRSSLSHDEILEQVHIATSISAESESFDLREDAAERFTGQGFAGKCPEVTLSASITKAAIVLLAAQWSAGMRIQTLYDRASELLAAHGFPVSGGARRQLAEELITLFEAGQVDLRLRELVYDTEVRDRL